MDKVTETTQPSGADARHEPGYVDASYLQAAARLLAPVKARSYALMRIEPGDQVLDLGCGPGIDTMALAELAGPEGRVVGIDADADMIAIAEARAAQAGLMGRIEHRQGSATALDLASDRFDACRSERLFIHLSDPVAALAEMKRVTRPGGWVVVVDSDWGSLSIDSTQAQTERRLARFRAEHLLSNGYSGRQLFRLFKEQGLSEVQVEAYPITLAGNAGLARYLTKMDEVEQGALEAGIISEGELEAWRTELRDADQAGTLFGSMSIILAAGRKS